MDLLIPYLLLAVPCSRASRRIIPGPRDQLVPRRQPSAGDDDEPMFTLDVDVSLLGKENADL